MRHSNTILDKVANEHTDLNSNWWEEFLKAIYDLYNVTEGVLDNDSAKSLLQLFSEKNDIPWEFAVQHLYYYIKEVVSNFYERFIIKMNWVQLCSDDSHTIGQFLKIKGNEKYASRELFESFCKRDNLVIEDCIAEFLLDAYGWKNVVWIIAFNVIEEYLSVEERYEGTDDVSEVEVKKSEMPKSELLDSEDAQTEVVYETTIPSTMDEEQEENTLTVETISKEDLAVEMSSSSEEIETYGKGAVRAFCLEDNKPRFFKSRKEAALELDIDGSSITNNIRGQRDFCTSKKDGKKYIFKDVFPKSILLVDADTKEIVQTFKKRTCACKEWGVSYEKLKGALNSKKPENHIIEGAEWWIEGDYYKQYKSVA